MRKSKIIFKVVLFCVIFVGLQYLVKSVTLDDKTSYGRTLLHTIYESDKNMDMIVCGASHCQFGINTSKVSEKYHVNAANMGTSAQGLETSLALIKEVAAYHDLKKVFVDLDYSMVMRESPNLESIYLISDYFRPSVRKIDYLLNATPFELYFNSFMPLHNGRMYTKNPRNMLEIVKSKLDGSYYQISTTYIYELWGSVWGESVLELEGAFWTRGEKTTLAESIPEEQKENLIQIIEFCEKNDIELEFICTPSSDFHITQITNYDEYVEIVREFLEEYGKKYYDFNLCKETMLPLNDDIYFKDSDHMNGRGAILFAEVLCDFFQGRISEEELFYSTYKEKMENSEPRFLGFEILNEVNQGEELQVLPMKNKEDLDVEIEVERLEGQYYIKAIVNGNVFRTLKLEDEKLR